MNKPQPRALTVCLKLDQLVRHLIAYPQDLAVECIPAGTAYQYLVRANAADVSRIVGKRGAHYRALVAIVNAMAGNLGFRGILLPISEPTVGKKERYPRFTPKADWDQQAVQQELWETACACLRGLTGMKQEDTGPLTLFTLTCQGDEDEESIALLSDSLDVIFKAVGLAKGRVVSVTIKTGAKPSRTP